MFFVSSFNDLATLNQPNVSLLHWKRMNNTLLVEYKIFVVEPGRNPLGGLVQRDERVNQGEGASTGAYSINPPQELTTRRARESVSRALIRCDLFPTTGLFRDARPPASSFQWAQDQRHDGWVLFLKWTKLSCEVLTWEVSAIPELTLLLGHSLVEWSLGWHRMWTELVVRTAAEVDVGKTEAWGLQCGGDTAGQLGNKFPELGGRNKGGKC